MAQSMLIVIQKGKQNEAFLQTPHFCGYKGFLIICKFSVSISRKCEKHRSSNVLHKTNNKQKINVGLILLLH